MKFFKLLSVVSIVTLFGCASAPTPVVPSPSVQASETKSAPVVDPSFVSGPFWSMNLEAPALWTKGRLLKGSTGEARTELFASTEEPKVYLEVLVGEHTEDDIVFIKTVLKVMADSERVKILKVKGVQTSSGEIAALVLNALANEDGSEPELVFRLITSKEGHGFVVACGGVSPKDFEKASALCMNTMKTFTLKATKSAPKSPKVPVSTPQSTQTFNDTSL